MPPKLLQFNLIRGQFSALTRFPLKIKRPAINFREYYNYNQVSLLTEGDIIENIKQANFNFKKDEVFFNVKNFEEGTNIIKINKIKSEVKFKISDDEIKKIFLDIINLFRDPFKVVYCLQILEDELREAGVNLQKNQVPELLIGNYEFLAPDPDLSQEYSDLNYQILRNILLKDENNHGINLDGVHVFCEAVSSKNADKIVGEGNIFEDTISSNISLHNPLSHRIGGFIVRKAVEEKFLEMSISQKEFLQLAVQTEVEFKTNFGERRSKPWIMIFDRSEIVCFDEVGRDNFFFSAVSPFILANTIIMSFGQEFGLENLQKIMYGRYCQDLQQMVDKLRFQDKTLQLQEFKDEELARYLQIYLMNFREHNAIGYDVMFTPTAKEIEENLKKKGYELTEYPDVLFLPNQKGRLLKPSIESSTGVKVSDEGPVLRG